MKELYLNYFKPLSAREKVFILAILGIPSIANIMNNTSLYQTVLLITLIIIAFIDIKYLKIPNILIGFLLGFLLINSVVVGDIAFVSIKLLSFFLVFILSLIYSLISQLGSGDVKLISTLSLAFDVKEIFVVFTFSIILASIISLFLLLIKKVRWESKVPFSPFIVVIVILFLSLK